MDRLTSLEAFTRTVELGSLTAAADALHMSPQLVGRHVQQLEARLGVRLLNRTTRRQSLTDFGRSFYERAKNILAELDAAENLAQEARASPFGRLRINAPVSFGMHTLAPRIPEFLRAYPQVSLDLSLSNRSIDLTEEGYDAVFRVGQLADSALIGRSLAPYRLVLCASPAYITANAPLEHPLDLQGHECLMYSHTELRTAWTFDGPTGQLVVPVSGRLMVDHGEPLLTAALAGLGILLQPHELVQAHITSGALRELLPAWQAPARPLSLLYASDRQLTPKLRSFIQFALAAFGEPP